MSAQAFGFVVAARRADLQLAQAFRRVGDGCFSQTTANGLAFVVRHYAATPESVDEEQPFIAEDTVLAYEGRVDNREEIAYALGQPHIAHLSDGAVLAAAYKAWGPELSAKVVGEYAYVVFDRRDRRLVAGQDSLGVRRIFYSIQGDRVWIASNLRLMFQQFPDARPSFNREALREYFSGFMSPWSGCTIWKGIRELGRSKVLVQRGTLFEEQTAWQPDPDRRVRFKDAEEVDEAFRTLLFDAVRGALRSPGPLLCDLSGGFDSSTICSVAALLAGARKDRQSIIGWSYLNRRSNESRFQDAVRLQHDIESHVLEIAGYLPLQVFNDAELPTLGFIQFGAIDRAMREFAHTRGIRSRLTGYAADALFQKGHPPPVYLSEWLREGRLRDWARDFAAYLRGGSFSAWHLLRDCTVGSLDMHAASFRSPPPDWFTREFHTEIRQTQHDFVRPRDRTFTSTARERIYRSTLCFMPPHGRMLPDERMPFVYRPLVEFILALDWEHIARPNEDRVLMRRALRGIVPEAVRTGGGKSNHGAPILEGLRASWTRIAPLLTGNQLAELGVVERKPFQAALETMRGGFSGLNRQFLNTALYLEIWLALKTTARAVDVMVPGDRDDRIPLTSAITV